MRRRQIFAMRSRQAALNPSGAPVAVPAAVDSSPSPVSREQEEATQAIWQSPEGVAVAPIEVKFANPEIVRCEYVGDEVAFKPKRKRLSLKGKRDG